MSDFYELRRLLTIGMSSIAGTLAALVLVMIIKIFVDQRQYRELVRASNEGKDDTRATLHAVRSSYRRISKAFNFPSGLGASDFSLASATPPVVTNNHYSLDRLSNEFLQSGGVRPRVAFTDTEEVYEDLDENLRRNEDEDDTYETIEKQMDEPEEGIYDEIQIRHDNCVSSDIYDEIKPLVPALPERKEKQLKNENDREDHENCFSSQLYDQFHEEAMPNDKKSGESELPSPRQDFNSAHKQKLKEKVVPGGKVPVLKQPQNPLASDASEDDEHDECVYMPLEEIRKRNFVKENKFKISEVLKQHQPKEYL